MIIQKVGFEEIKYPSLLKASKSLSLKANFDELSDIVSLVHQGISMSRGFSNINQSKLTERICSYISNSINPLFTSIIPSLGGKYKGSSWPRNRCVVYILL